MARSVSSNSDADTDAARLAEILAIAVHRSA